MAYDQNSPAQGHVALGDIDQIRGNENALRAAEASDSTSPPSNPVGGQFWWAQDVKAMYQRKNDNSGWSQALWYETDLPARTSDLSNHTGLSISNMVSVHGVKQGSGNGFDADTVDGQQASAFLGTSHNTASSGVHNQGSNVLLSAPTSTPFLIIASTAPTGWTQNTSWNDRVIRVVSGAGAGTGGAWGISGLTSGAHTHSTPTHSHNIAGGSDTGIQIYDINVFSWLDSVGRVVRYQNQLQTTSGSGGSTAPLAMDYTETSGGGTSGTQSVNSISSSGAWRPAYLDVIACTKNA